MLPFLVALLPFLVAVLPFLVAALTLCWRSANAGPALPQGKFRTSLYMRAATEEAACGVTCCVMWCRERVVCQGL